MRTRIVALAIVLTACGGEKPKPRVEKLVPTSTAPAVGIVPDAGASVSAAPAPAMTAPAPAAVVVVPAQVPEPTPASIVAPMPATFAERMRLGKKHARAGEVDDALIAYHAAAALDPAEPAPHIEMARLLL